MCYGHCAEYRLLYTVMDVLSVECDGSSYRRAKIVSSKAKCNYCVVSPYQQRSSSRINMPDMLRHDMHLPAVCRFEGSCHSRQASNQERKQVAMGAVMHLCQQYAA